MLNQEYLGKLEELKNKDCDAYKIIMQNNNALAKELSDSSHTIGNMLSFINCTSQYISDVHPEINAFEFWPEILDSLKHLINFTNRTSAYRYSFYKPDFSSMNLNEFLSTLPAAIENNINNGILPDYDMSERRWIFQLDSSIKFIETDETQLKSALFELTRNALEASPVNSPITISSKRIVDKFRISISSFSKNKQFLKHNSFKQIIQPFFTTKVDHAGLGLSIVNNICLQLNGNFCFKHNHDEIQCNITFPLAQQCESHPM